MGFFTVNVDWRIWKLHFIRGQILFCGNTWLCCGYIWFFCGEIWLFIYSYIKDLETALHLRAHMGVGKKALCDHV